MTQMHPTHVSLAHAVQVGHLRRHFERAAASSSLLAALTANMTFDQALAYRFAYHWGEVHAVNKFSEQQCWAYVRLIIKDDSKAISLLHEITKGKSALAALSLYGETRNRNGSHDYVEALFGPDICDDLQALLTTAVKRHVYVSEPPPLLNEPLPTDRPPPFPTKTPDPYPLAA